MEPCARRKMVFRRCGRQASSVCRAKYNPCLISRHQTFAIFTELSDASAGTANAYQSSCWVPVANLGMAYNIDKRWSFGFYVSYIPLATDGELIGRVGNAMVNHTRATIALDPYVGFLSIGYKF